MSTSMLWVQAIDLSIMPTVEVKRGRGRPRGSGKAKNSPSKVEKNHASVRRSTRVKPTTESQELEHVQSTELQRLLDEIRELKDKHADLEKTLEQVRYESTREVREATDDSDDLIQGVRLRNSAPSRRVNEAEGRGAQLEDPDATIVPGTQPGPSASCSSSRNAQSASPDIFDAPSEDGPPAPQGPQHVSNSRRAVQRKRKTQKRTKWPKPDEDRLVEIIGLIGPDGPFYAEAARMYMNDVPPLLPRDERQINDKLRNLKIYYLK